MHNVRMTILGLWVGSNKRPTDLTPSDFERLLELYDRHAFYGQIEEKLIDIEISFDAKDAKFTRWCDVIKYDDHAYSLLMTPWVLARLEYSSSEDRHRMYGDGTTVNMCVILAFEHQLVHLMSLIWGPDDVRPDSPRSGVHGSLYRCVSNEFFGSDPGRILDELAAEPCEVLDGARYTYWSNSCNVDTLTTTLLLCDTGAFRTAIFSTNASLTDYTDTDGVFRSVCTEGSRLTTIERWREFTSQVQAYMFEDYSQTDSQMKCHNLRVLLRECYTDMKTGGSWNVYNISEIYSLYVRMFPTLAYRNIPYHLVSHSDLIGTPRVSNSLKELFTFWDFMDPITLDPDDVDAAAQKYDWDAIDYEILVFRNGGIPAITRFGSDDSEIVNVSTYKRFEYDLPDDWVYSYNAHSEEYEFHNKETDEVQSTPPIGSVKSSSGPVPVVESRTVTKARPFGETILDGRYEMIGACILHGSQPGVGGGKHYTSYIKTAESWVYYNDIGPRWDELERFPDVCLTEAGGRKPELYIYKRT